MNHAVFLLYALAIVLGIGCSISLREKRYRYHGLAEALTVNYLIAAFTVWGAAILYLAVNVLPETDLSAVFMVGTGLILSGLAFFLPRQVQAIFEIPNSPKTLFLCLALLSLSSVVVGLFASQVIRPLNPFWGLLIPLFCLTVALVYSLGTQQKQKDHPFVKAQSKVLKCLNLAMPLIYIAMGLIEGLMFGEYVVERGVTITLPLIYLCASLMQWRFVALLFPARLVNTGSSIERPTSLTNKEFDIALAVYQGLSNKEIAAKLEVSPSTVKNHLYSVFKKLNVTNRVALIKCLQVNHTAKLGN